MDKQHGFTLLELMLTITIIGFLAAIAIPAYQDYTGRAQVNEAFHLAGAQKMAVTEYHANRGSFPASNGEAGIADADDIKGHYVESVTIEIYSGSGAAKIIAKMKDDKVSKTIKGKELILRGETTVTGIGEGGSYTWKCSPNDTGTTIEAKYLPANCRD